MPSDADHEFGEIALKHKLITKKQHSDALTSLKSLERKGKKSGKKRKKTPRLVDVLVQKEMLTGTEARTVQNAVDYRHRRREDKLYGRIALKSKFCKPKHVDKGLKVQKESYLDGEKPTGLADFLLEKNYLTEEEDEAIHEAMERLDAAEYMRGRKGKKKSVVDDDDDDDDDDDFDLDDDDDDLEELDDFDELDSGSGDDASVSLDDESDADELDSQIDVALSDFDDLDLDDDDDDKPHGLSSDDDLDDDDDDDLGGSDLDLDMGDDDDDDDLGSDDLNSGEESGLDSGDLDDLDLD